MELRMGAQAPVFIGNRPGAGWGYDTAGAATRPVSRVEVFSTNLY